MDGIELRHTAPVLPRTWGLLDTFYAEHRERLGAALGAGDSHFGAHDLGRVLTVFPGESAADLRRAIEGRTTSPHVRRRSRRRHRRSGCGSRSSTDRWCGSAASGAPDGSGAGAGPEGR